MTDIKEVKRLELSNFFCPKMAPLKRCFKFYISLFHKKCKDCGNISFFNYLDTQSKCELCEEIYCSICKKKKCEESHSLFYFSIFALIFFINTCILAIYFDSILNLLWDIKFYGYVIFVHYSAHFIKSKKENLRQYFEKAKNYFSHPFALIIFSLFLLIATYLCYGIVFGILGCIMSTFVYIELFD
jgi:hypothetical protein